MLEKFLGSLRFLKFSHLKGLVIMGLVLFLVLRFFPLFRKLLGYKTKVYSYINPMYKSLDDADCKRIADKLEKHLNYWLDIDGVNDKALVAVFDGFLTKEDIMNVTNYYSYRYSWKGFRVGNYNLMQTINWKCKDSTLLKIKEVYKGLGLTFKI